MNIVLLLFIQHIKTPKIKVVFEEIFLIPLILKIRKKAAGLVELQSYQIVSILISVLQENFASLVDDSQLRKLCNLDL